MLTRRFFYVSLGILALAGPPPAYGENVAFEAHATASNYCNYPGNPAASTPPWYAFDGIVCPQPFCPNGGWNACDVAPQWIQGLWNMPSIIDSLRLNVNQDPGGSTTHEIRFRRPSGDWTDPWVVQGNWGTYDLVTLVPPFVVEATGIRIETTVSPSWVSWFEIEVIGRPTATGVPIPLETPLSWGKMKSVFTD